MYFDYCHNITMDIPLAMNNLDCSTYIGKKSLEISTLKNVPISLSFKTHSSNLMPTFGRLSAICETFAQTGCTSTPSDHFVFEKVKSLAA